MGEPGGGAVGYAVFDAVIPVGSLLRDRASQNLDESGSIELDVNLVQARLVRTMLNISRDIHSLLNFKRNTTDFIAQLKKIAAPVVLTINGKAELVVQDAAAYQKLLDRVEELEVIAGIKRGLDDVRVGRTRPLAEFEQAIQQKYDIQD